MARVFLILAGLMGASGMMLAAAAAHGHAGAGLDSAGYLLLIHAAAILAGLGLLHQDLLARLTGRIALGGFALGAALFAGDIAARTFLGTRLFPMAAPTGGTILIASWLAVALAGLMARRPD